MRSDKIERVAGLGLLAVALCSTTACTGRARASEAGDSVAEQSVAQPAHVSHGPSHGPSHGIELLGKASIAPDASDLSGLTDKLENGMPQNRIGSFGSAIAWTGDGDRYIVVPDRGPADGAVGYRTRFHELTIRVRPGETPPVRVELVKTTLFTNESGQSFVGIASAFDAAHPEKSLRLDPEGARVGRDGHLFVSEEYGPLVLEFDRSGHLLKRLPVPSSFAIEHPSADRKVEIESNTHGRVANKGLEGLAITPEGNRLYALIESPLIQDHGKKGINCRMIEFDLDVQETRELVLPLDDPKHDFNELLAIDDHRFLAIERDNESGEKARFKRIVLVDFEGASDVSLVPMLPETGLGKDIVAMKKKPFLDLLDAKFGLAGAGFPEKVEGLAFGPDLPDGRHVLIVTTDNDFSTEEPSWFWVFAIDPAEMPKLVPQRFGSAR